MADEYVKPMVVIDDLTGERYTLDFTRESVMFAQNRGFKVGEVREFPTINIKKLWYYAFRANHKSLAENQTDKLFDKLFPDGMFPTHINRLVELYEQAAYDKLVLLEEDSDGKNPNVTVEL
jgi:hypothetical protein